MIEIDGLTKRYGDKMAVDGLSFVVELGVVTGFLGPNRHSPTQVITTHFAPIFERSSAWRPRTIARTAA